ncbi:hypothetical protein LZ30DRAFT_755181 [Colletotrichum cereale]|nr:hypothetical protein LZ30DRAFT_755181 [Colletotrichum cereale]
MLKRLSYVETANTNLAVLGVSLLLFCTVGFLNAFGVFQDIQTDRYNGQVPMCIGSGILLGISLSLVFCPPMAIVSFAWTIRAVAFIMMPLLVIACCMVVDVLAPTPLPAAPESSPDGNEKGTSFIVFKNKTFVLLCCGLALGYFGLFTPLFFVSAFGISNGMPSLTAFYLLSRLNRAHFNVLTLAVFLAGIVGFCWTVASSLAGLAVWSLAYGFFSGAVISLALVGPPISGQIVAHLGYLALSIWTGVTLVVGAAIVVAARWRLSP